MKALSLKKVSLYSIIIFLAFMLLSSCISFYVIPSRQFNYAKSHAPYDAIIVPGIPFNDNAWDSLMKVRVMWGVYLYKQGIADNIIFSGSSVYTPYYESEIMKKYAIKLGVDSNHIFTEKKAHHGVENLYYSYKMGKKIGFNTMAIATDPAQNLQIAYYGRPLTAQVSFFPAYFAKISLEGLDTITINPESAYNPNFVSYSEQISNWERLQRSRGKGGLKKEMNKLLKDS